MRHFLLISLFCLFGLSTSFADSHYPSKPITLVIPFPQGAETDIYAQIFSRHIGKYLAGAQIKPSYQTGDFGNTATQLLTLSPADGYTLMYGRVAHLLINPTLNPAASYQLDSFSTLGIIELIPSICAVNNSSPYKSAADLIQAIRKHPTKFKHSSVGALSTPYFSVKYMLFLSGIDPMSVENMSFTNGVGSVNALAHKDVDFACENASLLIPLIKSGKVRGLFTTSSGRISELPTLPTAREVGLRDMEKIASWTALVAPPNLPDDIIKKWKVAMKALANDPQWQEEVKQAGGFPTLLTILDSQRYLQEQANLYERLSIKLGAQK